MPDVWFRLFALRIGSGYVEVPIVGLVVLLICVCIPLSLAIQTHWSLDLRVTCSVTFVFVIYRDPSTATG